MFPFGNAWQWHLASRPAHLVEATQGHLDAYREPYRSVAQRRAQRVRVALKIRFGFLVLLSPSLVATAATAMARLLPRLQDAVDVLDTVLRIVGALSIVLTILFLLTTRYLGQLEADLIACLALGVVDAQEMPEAEG